MVISRIFAVLCRGEVPNCFSFALVPFEEFIFHVRFLFACYALSCAFDFYSRMN